MKNSILDKFFKAKLSNLDGGAPLNTWELLSDKMDMQLPDSLVEDQGFDQKIKEAIGNISAIEMPSWQAFVPSLDLEENLEDIETDIALDDTVKNSLENLDLQYDPTTWDTLADRLDVLDHTILESQAEEIDQVSYQKLLNYTVPQKAGDWEAFNRELNKEFVLPYKLLFNYKLAEIAILASLILIFFQAKPVIQNHFESKKLASATVLSETQKSSELLHFDGSANNNSTVAKPADVNKKIDAAITKSDELSVSTVADKTNTIYHNLENHKVESASNNSNSFTQNNSISSATTSILANKQSVALDESLSSNTAITAIVQSTSKQVEKKETPVQLVKQEDKSILPKYDSFLSVEKLPTESLMNIPFAGDNITACFSCDTDNTILRWRLGAHVDAVYTYILTPYDNILNLRSYNHATLGYGAGLSASLVLDKWELESGFKFISRQYTPRRASQNVGNIAQGWITVEISKIQMNVLSVPLNLRYHFNSNNGKTHFYLHGGATMSVATQVNQFRNSSFFGQNKRPSLDASRELFEESDIISDKIFANGWFDGGSYIENRYFTVNLGLGFERKISSRYSIFGQTTYAQYLDNKGIGVNNDRFNTVEFSTGVRALFK